jgi:hypothetical protein
MVAVYRSVTLVEGLLLTRELGVSNVRAVPIQRSTLGSDGPVVLNNALEQLGRTYRVDHEEWINGYRIRHPAVVVIAEGFEADTFDQAGRKSEELVGRLVTLLAYYRDAAPNLLASVLERRESDTDWIPEGVGMHGKSYEGNLVGGFISGEDPRTLQRDWDAIDSINPSALLWMRLLWEARAETNLGFRIFRLVDLLEAISKERVTDEQPVTDAAGVQLTEGGKPATTKHTRGVIHNWAVEVARRRQTSIRDMAFPGSNGFWEACGVWVGLRNAVAHYGGFRPDDPRQQREWWHGFILSAFKRVTEAQPTVDPMWTYASQLAWLAKFVVWQELRSPPTA